MKNVVSFKLRSNGQELSEGFKVKSIVIVNEANRIPRADILVLDGDVSKQDFNISNQDFFKPGRNLEIDLGYESKVENVFKGVIVKISIKVRESNASYLEVVCKHPAVKLTTHKKSRLFSDVNDKEAITEILDEAKISHSVEGMTDFKHTQLIQYESAAWDFIISRVEANAGLVLFDKEKLLVSGPSMDGEPVLKCEYGGNVFTFDAILDSESQYSAVEGRAWSSTDQDILESEARIDFKNGIGNLTSKELAEVLGHGPYQLHQTANLLLDELRQWTKGKAIRNELSKVLGNVGVRGTASVYPGKVIELSGFGDRFSGKAFVTGVRHEVTQGGWKSHIQFGLPSTWFAQQPNFNALPASGALPAVSGLQIGVVTQLAEDPENEFRIRVRIPAMSNEGDGVWAHQAKIYAGNDYGICFSPELGDEVVMGFLNEDPRKAVVLGVLHSSGKTSPLALTDDNFQKAIISRKGLKVVWDDDKMTVTIATPGGHHVTLDDNNKRVSIHDSNQNKFEMNDQGIILQSAKNLKLSAVQNIELEALNVQCKASGKFSAEGNGGAEVKTSSIAVLKGSLVQIN